MTITMVLTRLNRHQPHFIYQTHAYWSFAFSVLNFSRFPKWFYKDIFGGYFTVFLCVGLFIFIICFFFCLRNFGLGFIYYGQIVMSPEFMKNTDTVYDSQFKWICVCDESRHFKWSKMALIKGIPFDYYVNEFASCHLELSRHFFISLFLWSFKFKQWKSIRIYSQIN